MADLKETVQTDVDALVNLVKKRKEISFEDASIELSLPFSTIESWANFLEEEDELSINYKFTTPYLVAIDNNIEINENVLNKAKEHSSNIHNMFTLFSENLNKEDYSSAYSDSLRIHGRIKELVNEVSKDKHLSDTINPNLILERLNVFQNIISHTHSLKQKNDIERLKAAYSQIHADLNEVFISIKKTIEEKHELHLKNKKERLDEEKNINEKKNNEDKKNKKIETNKEKIEIDFNINSLGDYQKFMDLASKSLEENNYETAKEIYSKLNEYYNNLPQTFNQNKQSLKEALINLNKELTNKLGDESIKLMHEKSSEIHSLARLVRQNIEENKLHEAEKLFSKIELIFSNLPKGFLDMKINLENLIVSLHSELINVEKDDFVKRFNENKEKINKLIIKINDALLNSDLKTIKSIYDEILNLFNNLPEGFLQERIEIQRKISAINEHLLFKEKELKESEFKEKVMKINIIYEEVEQFISSDDFEGAFLKLSELNDIFDTIPNGFIEQKSELENKILNLSKKVLILEQQHSTKLFNDVHNRIEKLFLSANNYLSKNENDFAMEIYKEILSLYNMMPKGFLREKSKIKTRILELYQTLMLNDNEDVNKSLTGNTKLIYQKLLNNIVKIHQNIDKHKFESLGENYKKLVSFYNELPIGFVQQRTNIRHEILKIYDLSNLYNYVKTLENKFEKNDFNEIKKIFDNISVLYHELYEHCKEDAELFIYVKERYDYFSAIINNNINYDNNNYNNNSNSNNYNSNDKNNQKINEVKVHEDDIKKTKKEFILKKKILNNEINVGDNINIENNNDQYFVDEFIKTNKYEKLYDLAVKDFIEKKIENSFSNLKKLSKIDSLNNKYEYLLGLIIKIKSNNFLNNDLSNAFFELINRLYRENTVDSRLSFSKLVRGTYDLLDHNVPSAISDLKKIYNMYPGDKNIILLYNYAKRLENK
jgi:hypothetical protein